MPSNFIDLNEYRDTHKKPPTSPNNPDRLLKLFQQMTDEFTALPPAQQGAVLTKTMDMVPLAILEEFIMQIRLARTDPTSPQSHGSQTGMPKSSPS